MAKVKPILLDGNTLTLEQVEAIARGAPVEIDPKAKQQVDASRKLVQSYARSAKPYYGINTGFGYFANQKISSTQLKTLQTNLLKSHASGYGAALSLPETRVIMALRLNTLLKGHTGVRFDLCLSLQSLITAGIYPVIPEYGSVGASGDLAPLAHLALPIIGEGVVHYRGKIMPAADALKKAHLSPLQLVEKEGLGLINGTQVMLGVGTLALLDAMRIVDKADQVTALTYEGMVGRIEALDPLIHRLRNQSGQVESAARIRHELEGSYLFNLKTKRSRIQDPYSLRCGPQIHGPSRDAIKYALQVCERELNAGTDNPLVFSEEEEVLSGGNFHGQALALAFDFAAMALSEIANVSDRRLELLLNPHMSGLPAFLSPQEGLCSGYMAAQYLSASLVNECKLLANPACTDSIPGNVGVEDHVSMGMTSARKLKKLVDNVSVVLSIEMVVAAQAIDLRRSGPLGKGTQKMYDAIRSVIPTLTEDRILFDEINQAVELLKNL